jgi:membrane-associated phospholipid phosphatase
MERRAPARREGTADDQSAEQELGAPGLRLRILPHEIVFGAFLLITWIRLVAAAGFLTVPALGFLSFLVASGVVIAWAKANPSPLRWRIRLLFYPSVMGLAFYLLTPAMKLLAVPKADALLNGWDTALFGTNLSVAWQGFSPPLFTDLMMAGYLFYFLYLVGGPATYCVRDLPKFRLLMVGLFTVHGLGFLGYTIWPAGGPHVHLSFDQPLIGGRFTRLMAPVVITGSNGVDVFPSLHLAVSLYLLGFDWRFDRRRFWWVFAPCVTLWVSTIYLRYHYFVDLLAGAILAAVGWSVATWWARTKQTEH